MRVLCESLAILGLAVAIGSVWLSWSQLPPRIPTHFGFSGPPNGFGPKTSLLELPVIAILFYFVLTLLSRFPQVFNYPVKVTEGNSGRLHSLGVAVVGWLKAELVWTFAWLTLTTVRVALGQSSGLNAAFLPVSLGVVGVTVILFWTRMLKLA
jgi:hypothetical protein